MSGVLELDPGECWIRHVKRTPPPEVLRTNLIANPASNPSPTVTSSSGSSAGQPAASVVQTADWSAPASPPWASRYTVTRNDAAATNLVARTATGAAGIAVKPGHYYAFRVTVHIEATLMEAGVSGLLASIRARLTWARADGTTIVTGIDSALTVAPAVDSVTELYVIGRAPADAAFVSVGALFTQGPGLLTLIADLDAFVLVDLGPDFAGPTGAATLNADVPAYFDGHSAGARWTGIGDGSPSELLAVDPDAVSVLSAQFSAQPLEGVNGRQGWQSAQPEVRLSDDGSFTVTFPNAAGEDGIRHLDRFAIFTDPLYRPGEEWLEFYREPDDGDPLFVGTPTRAGKDGSAITIEGLDALVLLRNALSSETDLLVGMAPADALRLFGGCVPVLQEARDFAGWTAAELVQRPGFPADSLWDGGVDGYTYLGCAPSPEGDGILLETDGDGVTRGLQGTTGTVDPTVLPVGADKGTDWIIEVRYRHLAAPATSDIRTGTANFDLTPRHDVPAQIGGDGVYAWSRPVPGKTAAIGTTKLTYPVPSEVVHRIVARGDWLYCFVNGELVIRTRRSHFADAPGDGDARSDADHPYFVVMGVERGAKAVLKSWRFLTLEPLLMPDAPADKRLPGTPPPGGLRGRYYLEHTARGFSRAISFPDGFTPVLGVEQPASFHALALDPLLEPYAERLETINFAGANPPAWQPPGPPNGEAWSARWTGAIFLDLEATDRTLGFDLGGETYGRGRVYIGGKLILDYTAAFGTPPPAGHNIGQVFAADLRAILGARAGWFPILVEFSHFTGAGGIKLMDGVTPAANTPIPASRLSPIGTVDREVRNEAHRDVFGDLAESFGYQWRLEPRSLESGRFPGELVVGDRVGHDTDLRVGAPDAGGVEAFEVVTTVDAGDAVDGLLADASGLADNTSSAQLSLEAYNPGAVDRFVYASAYESLAEISEAPLLQSRAESFLIARSSPAETVGVRPAGTRKLVDRFPLPATPELERMLWLPGDGLRLDLPDIGVVDPTPRQLTLIQWPMTPDGAAPPIVGFRQRTRGGRTALERLTRSATQPQRYYQGQLARVLGTIGLSPAGAYGDTFSRIALPANLGDVVKLELQILTKSDASAWGLEMQGTATGVTITRAGIFDVTRYLTRAPNGLSTWARLTGGTGSCEVVLTAVVRV